MLGISWWVIICYYDKHLLQVYSLPTQGLGRSPGGCELDRSKIDQCNFELWLHIVGYPYDEEIYIFKSIS